MKIFKARDSRYPTSSEGLAALASLRVLSDTSEWSPLLESEILDPWGNPYGYEYPPGRNARGVPDIFSSGEDMQFGTEDDIGNWEE